MPPTCLGMKQDRDRHGVEREHPMVSGKQVSQVSMQSLSCFHSGVTTKNIAVQKNMTEDEQKMLSNLCSRLYPLNRDYFEIRAQNGGQGNHKNGTGMVQDTHSASESCLQWRLHYWFWRVNLVLLRINQVCVPKYPMSSNTKHTPIFHYFPFFFFLPWLTCDFPSKLTMTKSQLLNIRVQPAGSRS